MDLDSDPLAEIWRSPRYRRVMIGLLLSLGLTVFLLFGTVSIDLTCQRSPQGSVDCLLLRKTALLRMSPVEISDPAAVDVVRPVYGDSYPRAYFSKRYSLELRLADKAYYIPLTSYFRRDNAYKAAKDVNDFLLHSDAPAFSKHFPVWQLETFGVED